MRDAPQQLRLHVPERLRRSGGQLAIALTVGLLGFLLAIQLRSQDTLADRLAIERESDLGRLLTELAQRSDQIQEEIVDLRVRLATTTGSEAQEQALLESARAELRALRILLGIVPVEGPGIVVSIEDPLGSVGPEVLLDAVQELRDAGAEAIEVAGQRVVAQTAFSGQAGALTVGSAVLRPPYVIRAIGEPSTLAEAMRIPSGVVDAVGARDGASVRIEERPSIDIRSVARPPAFVHARPRR